MLTNRQTDTPANRHKLPIDEDRLTCRLTNGRPDAPTDKYRLPKDRPT